MTRRSATTLAALGLVGLAGLAFGTSAPAWGSNQPGEVTGPATQDTNYLADSAANHRADVVSAELQPVLNDSMSFATLRIVASGIEIGVVGDATDLSRSVADTLQAAPFTVPVTYVQQKYTANQLTDISAQLTSDSRQLSASGIELSLWGPDEATDRVVVHLAKYSDDAAAAIAKTYGDRVTVSDDSIRFTVAGRYADTQPWYGADRIYRNATPDVGCTAWFSVYDATQGYNVTMTAAHCDEGYWYNGGSSNHNIGNSSYYRGHVDNAWRHWSGSTDAERSNDTGNAGPRVWSTPTSSNRIVHTIGWNETQSAGICTDGSYTTEVCGTISLLHQQVQEYDANLNPLVLLTDQSIATASTRMCQEGDSGGPVYTVPTDLNGLNQYVAAHGMIIATNDTGTICAYTPVTDVLGPFGDNLQILTGS